ncbi:MAG: T9SS type A sorting domain-containing protein [Saprospiraceae bacterium]
MKKHLFPAFLFFLCSYSLIAQEWEQVSSLPSQFDNTHHSFGFSLNGMGYLTTGSSPNGERNDFYQYDPIEDEWTALDDFPGEARSFAIGDIWDGKAYFGFGFGDSGDELRDFWVFDPEDMSWTELEACPCPGRLHPAMIAHNDKVFMGMGNNSGGNRNDWWEYDIETNTWSEKPNFPALPRHHPFQFGIGDYVYTGLGHGNGFISDRWYRYDPITEDWEEMTSLPAEGRVAGTQFSLNGIGYVLSGDGEDHMTMEEGEFWSYDPLLDEWDQLPSHPSVSRWAPSSFVIDGEVYIINGQSLIGNGYQYVSSVYKFRLEESTPSSVEDLEEFSFNAFPNPFSNEIQLEWDRNFDINDATISVYNIYGQMVFETEELTNSLDLSKLQNGWLRIELKNSDKTLSKSVLKQ